MDTYRGQRKITEPEIICRCLYEAYGIEKDQLLSGKQMRHTMVYPFLKMLANEFVDIDIRKIHKGLWAIFCEGDIEMVFVKRAEKFLEESRGQIV